MRCAFISFCLFHMPEAISLVLALGVPFLHPLLAPRSGCASNCQVGCLQHGSICPLSPEAKASGCPKIFLASSLASDFSKHQQALPPTPSTLALCSISLRCKLSPNGYGDDHVLPPSPMQTCFKHEIVFDTVPFTAQGLASVF